MGRGGFNPLIGIDGPKRAIAMLREAHMLMRRMLEGNKAPFAGEFFSATEELYFQYDIGRRDIPIFIGTWGPKMARMAGKIAPGIKADCVANPKYVRTLGDEMRAGAIEAGREPDKLELIVGPLCSISQDRDRAVRQTKELLALLQSALAPMTANEGITKDEIDRAATAFHAGDVDGAVGCVSDTAVRAFSLTGTPADIIPQIEALVDAGVTNIAFGPPLGPDFMAALNLIATQVLPAFKTIRE